MLDLEEAVMDSRCGIDNEGEVNTTAKDCGTKSRCNKGEREEKSKDLEE